MIRCLFIQGMTDYWLQRQPWKIVQRNWLSPCGWCDFLLRFCSFLGTICSGNEEGWFPCRKRRTASAQSWLGTCTAGLGECLLLPLSRPGLELSLQHPGAPGWAPLFLTSQNTGKGFTCSGGKLLPQAILGAGYSSRHRPLCPSCHQPDTLSTRDHAYFFVNTYKYMQTYSPPCEPSPVGL